MTRGVPLLLALALVTPPCDGEDEPPQGPGEPEAEPDPELPASCDLEVEPAVPDEPDCDDIETRIYEVTVETWAHELDHLQDGERYVRAEDCQPGGDGSLDHPYCSIDEALGEVAGHGLDPVVYVDPGVYEIAEALPDPGPDPEGGGLRVEIRGAGAAHTSLLISDGPTHHHWTFSGLSLQAEALTIDMGRIVRFEDVILEGLAADGLLDVAGGQLEVERTLIRSTVALADEEPTGTSEQAHYINILPYDETLRPAVFVSDGGLLFMTGFCVDNAILGAVLVRGEGADAELHSGVIRATRTAPAGWYGYGLDVDGGAAARVYDTALVDNRGAGALVSGESSLSLDSVTIRGTATSAGVADGVGAMAQRGAKMSVTDSRFVGCDAPGVVSTTGATVTVDGSSFDDVLFSGLMVINGSLSVDGCHVGGAGFHPSEGGGVGLFAWEPAGDESLSLAVSDSVFEGIDNHGWYVVNGRGGETEFSGNRVVDVGDANAYSADAWFVDLDTPPVLLANCFSGPRQLLFDDASASLSGNAYLADPSGVFTIHQQRCGAVDVIDVSQEILPDPDLLEICADVNTLGPLLEYMFWLSETGIVG